MTLSEQLLEEILIELQRQGQRAAGGSTAGATGGGAAGGIVNGVVSAGKSIVNLATGPIKLLHQTAMAAANGMTSLASAATDGAASLSQVTGIMANMATAVLPKFLGVTGLLTNAVQMAATVTETNIRTQQELGKSGASFGGSLTQMRVAAGNAYLGLQEFSAVVRTNSDVLSTMGGNVQSGVKAFTSIQNTLLKPGTETSTMLANLGVSSQEAAELTASFMRSQGSMNKEQLRDNKMVAASVAQYASELSVLSSLTGKSREALQKELDARNREAQYQAYLTTLSEEEAKKLRQGMQLALLQGGEGAVDAFQSLAMGFPPLTEAGQLYAATQTEGMRTLEEYNSRVKNSSITADEAAKLNRKSLAEQIVANQNNLESMKEVLQANALTGGALAKNAAAATELATKFRGMTSTQIEAAIADIEKTQANTDKSNRAKQSEAQAAADMQKAVQQLTNEMLLKLLPGLNYLLDGAVKITRAFGRFTTAFFDMIRPLGPPIARAAELIGGAFGGMLEKLTAPDGPMSKFGEWLEEKLVPAINYVTDWFLETFRRLGASEGVGDFFSRLLSQFGELFGKVWQTISPPIIKFFDETVKPMMAKLFTDMLDWLISALRKNSRIARFLFSETETEQEERKKMESDADYKSRVKAAQLAQSQLSPEMQTGIDYEAIKREWQEEKARKALVNQTPPSTPTIPKPSGRASGSIGATGKIFENFGSKTNVDLHGTESVITPSQMSELLVNAMNSQNNNQLSDQLNQLNNLTQQLITIMRETAENTRRNVEATQNLNGNLFM